MGGYGLSGVAEAMVLDGMVAICIRSVENSPPPKQLGAPDTSTVRQDHMLTLKQGLEENSPLIGSWSMPMQGIEYGNPGGRLGVVGAMGPDDTKAMRIRSVEISHLQSG